MKLTEKILRFLSMMRSWQPLKTNAFCTVSKVAISPDGAWTVSCPVVLLIGLLILTVSFGS